MSIPANSTKRIMTVFGTRPEAIKMFPVVHALRAQPGIDARVCVTAQHRDLLDQVLDIAQIVPDVGRHGRPMACDLCIENGQMARGTLRAIVESSPLIICRCLKLAGKRISD